MNDLEVRQLRYFVTVAEELHFGRAADRLGMAQPPLSRAIRELERRLDVRLLERTTRQVALTAAGEVLLRDARTALDAITAAERRVRNAGQATPRLRVALKADNDAGLLKEILTTYQSDDAAIAVELVLGTRGEQAPALRDGRADVGLVTSPFDARGLDVEPLLSEPRLAALAATDPLAGRECLRLADLAGRILPDGAPADHAAETPERPPQLVTGTAITDLTQILKLVELESVVCFLPVSVAQRYARPEIVFRPVGDLPPARLSIAWPQDARSPAVAAFVRAAVSVATAVRP